MGLIDGIKNFFGTDPSQTMNTGALFALNDPADYEDYNDFDYPYPVMQRTKRFPKMMNAYSLQHRANLDMFLFRNHKSRLDRLNAQIELLQEKVDNLVIGDVERYELNKCIKIGTFLNENVWRFVYEIHGYTGLLNNNTWYTLVSNLAIKNEEGYYVAPSKILRFTLIVAGTGSNAGNYVSYIPAGFGVTKGNSENARNYRFLTCWSDTNTDIRYMVVDFIQ